MERRKIQFFCPVASLKTGRIHPASFQIGYGATNLLIQHGGRVYCILLSFHQSGFHESNAAMEWMRQDNKNNLPILPGVTIPGGLQVDRCVRFPEKLILDLIQVKAS